VFGEDELMLADIPGTPLLVSFFVVVQDRMIIVEITQGRAPPYGRDRRMEIVGIILASRGFVSRRPTAQRIPPRSPPQDRRILRRACLSLESRFQG
jgi:hypothetical protein